MLDCKELSDFAIRGLINKAKRLKQLYLDMIDISDQILLELAASKSGLNFLSINMSPKITEEVTLLCRKLSL